MRRAGCLTQILLSLTLGLLGIGLVIALLNPWALHMGGRWTPFLMWRGLGTFRTGTGREYPLFLYIYPSAHSSRLRSSDGRRPTSGLSGYACLCTTPMQQLELSGTIYGSWQSADGALVTFRLLERRTARDHFTASNRGYIDLYGAWRGPDLVMDSHGSWVHPFRSGLRLDRPSLTLHPDDHWTCSAACAAGHVN